MGINEIRAYPEDDRIKNLDRPAGHEIRPSKVAVTVLGIGNILMGDEGAGVRALETLRERYEFPEGVCLLDGGTMGLDLLYYLEGTERLLMIDAVSMGAPPGTVRMFDGPQIPSLLAGKFSVHEIGLQDLFFALDITGRRPSDSCLAGIEPKEVELGLELSPEMKNALPGLADAVAQRLGRWGIDVRKKA